LSTLLAKIPSSFQYFARHRGVGGARASKGTENPKELSASRVDNKAHSMEKSNMRRKQMPLCKLRQGKDWGYTAQDLEGARWMMAKELSEDRLWLQNGG
jgi:hypothetical protein